MLYKIEVLILILLVPLLGLHFYARSQGMTILELFQPHALIAHIDEIPLKVEVVSTPSGRTQGLSGRKDLSGIDGMLFVFDTTSSEHGIWMKDMNFPIDIIWIGEDLKVVSVDRSVRPDSYPKVYRPPRPVRYVIETNDRFTETFGIDAGDPVRMPPGIGKLTP